MRGRKPKPTHLKLLDGNPGKGPINRNEPQPEGALILPPPDLPPGAVPFWEQAIADAPGGLLKMLDLRMLFIWSCAAWQHSDAAGKVAASGSMLRSAEGVLYQNPLLAVMNRQALIMMRAASEMGFTPTSRSRIKVDPSEAGNAFAEFA